MITCALRIIEREHFDTLCASIRHLTTKENGEIKASLKLKIGYVLKKLIKTAKGHYIQANEMEKSVEVDSAGSQWGLHLLHSTRHV